MSASGIGSKSHTTLHTTVSTETGRTEDRKVALQGTTGSILTGENSRVTINSRVNGYTGKDIGNLLAGITHDSAFGQQTATGTAPTTAAAVPAGASSSLVKPALYIGAGVLVLVVAAVFLAKRR